VIDCHHRTVRFHIGPQRIFELIPSPFNQHPCAQSRSPIDMILQGWAVSLFQVSEQ
jgi:hypothetical protein